MCLKERPAAQSQPKADVEDGGDENTTSNPVPLDGASLRMTSGALVPVESEGSKAPGTTATTTTITTAMSEVNCSPPIAGGSLMVTKGDGSLTVTKGDCCSLTVTKGDSGSLTVVKAKKVTGSTPGERECTDSVFVIVRDASSAITAGAERLALSTPANSTVGELFSEVARRLKYEADSFSLVLQLSAANIVVLELLDADTTLLDAGFIAEGTPANNTVVCDLRGNPPRRCDDDDLSLGASASPTASATEKKWYDSGSTWYDSSSTPAHDTTPEYSYSAALIKHDTGYVGLVNQAMTCYLNSLLQTLFMTPEFRNALYRWEYTGSVEEAARSIPYQLQRLFLQLQTTSRTAVETTNLTRSFGWDSSEAWQQHDIQELCRVMFDALEQCFKNTDQADLINNLYEGKMKDYVKCLECGTESAREDTYLDIPLPIRQFGSSTAYKSLEEALRAFVEPELLTGNNKYKCCKCDSLCDAHKGLKFAKFPYLLTIHLKRFDFDYQTFHRIKLNDKVTFPNLLDLNSFIEDSSKTENCSPTSPEKVSLERPDDASTSDSGSVLDAEESSVEFTACTHNDLDTQEEDEGIDVSSLCNEKNKVCVSSGPYIYDLFSIMVHSGSASGGHYYAYIKDFTTSDWFCFNDQSVTRITHEDIRKTYGGSSSCGYYSNWTSSANAYMLMYRQADKERNTTAFTKEEFPQHIKDLVERMVNEEAAEREAREAERSMCRIRLLCQHPKTNAMMEKKLRIHKDSTLREAIQMAYQEMGLEGIIPVEQCRLVKYEEFHDSLECSFEGLEDSPMADVLGGARSSYKFELLLETREAHKQFEVYKPGGITVKVYVVNLQSEEVEGPHTVRASQNMTVQEFKELLSRHLSLDDRLMRIVVERYSDHKFLSSNDKTLKAEGFVRSNKVYVEASGEEPNTYFRGSLMSCVVDRFENTITLYCSLPDTSKETLEELHIPPYIEEPEIESSAFSQTGDMAGAASDEHVEASQTADSVDKTHTEESHSLRPDVVLPPDVAAPPVSTVASAIPKSPTGISALTQATSTTAIAVSSSEKSIVNGVTSALASQALSAGSIAKSVASSISASASISSAISTAASSVCVGGGNMSDGEDEGIMDMDPATSSSAVNSDQSTSEDSSQTSDSDRTLVGDPPEDKLSDTSNSPDYHNVSSPEDGNKETMDDDSRWGFPVHQSGEVDWDDDSRNSLVKRYFRAEYCTDETNQRLLRVYLDKRITIGQLKTELQKWVGVSEEHFKLIKIYSNNQEFECSRMTDNLTTYNDNTRLLVRLGRALLPGEHWGKVFLLEPNNQEEHSRFLIDWVLRCGETVRHAKAAIVKEVNAQCHLDLSVEKVRLRKKSWKNPQTIYPDHLVFDEHIPIYSNWHLYIQVLEEPEEKTTTDELSLFVKWWHPSTYIADMLVETVIKQRTTDALRQKLSELTDISAEDVEFAKPKGTFPCDMSVLDITNDLDWTQRHGHLEQRPLYIMEDGCVIYFRDRNEPLQELTESERNELLSQENRRLNRDLQYACPGSSHICSVSRTRERGLKIYLTQSDE